MSADTIVGEQVHQLMWRNKVSQTKLAGLLRLAQPNVGKRLRGETSWTLDELLVVARFFDVPLTDLLPDDDYEPSPAGRGRAVASGQGGQAASPILDGPEPTGRYTQPISLPIRPRLALVLGGVA